jgi:DNA-binding NarL/FixJ family response regulator
VAPIGRKRVAVVDEQEIFRRGVVASLGDDPLLEVVFQASAGSPGAPVDVAVTSAQAATVERFECPVVVCIAASEPKAWSDREDINVLAVVHRTSITAEELAATVRAAAIGLRVNPDDDDPELLRGLDCRRREVLRLLSEGADTQDISRSLCYSERTIKSLIQDIERRLSAQTRAQAVAEGIRHGLI